MNNAKESDPEPTTRRKTIGISTALYDQVEDRYAPTFGALNWSAYVTELIERDLERDINTVDP